MLLSKMLLSLPLKAPFLMLERVQISCDICSISFVDSVLFDGLQDMTSPVAVESGAKSRYSTPTRDIKP